MRVKIGVIGGTGVYNPDILKNVEVKVITTPYGQIELTIGENNDKKVAFLPRHGGGHTVPPHKINYRGNIAALKFIGVEKIIATAAVGSLNKDLGPGSLVLIDQFIDFTKQRTLTFFEAGDVYKAHIDVSQPYCGDLQTDLMKVAEKAGIALHQGGCYVCAEGPRYETAAEIRAYRMLGGDVVGMTGVPEVVLARELGLCYANISIITNWAAGINPKALSHAEVVTIMNENQDKLRRLIAGCLEAASETCRVNCCHI
jgi:5'-methylthioadenosine phosphorylase